MQICLVSYRPLIVKADGRRAIEKYGFHPFFDSSCRREPDFEADPPSITALCRGGNFAPHLNEGDIVIYLARKDLYSYLSDKPQEKHWRFVALLEIDKRFNSHHEAAKWYKSENKKLPSNCLVACNQPLSLDKTAPPRKYKKDLDGWDAFYQRRMSNHPVFLICTTQWMNLDNPPFMTEEIMRNIFGNLKGTQNPPRDITPEQLKKLKRFYGIEAIAR
jgi:hypothetical protein